MGKSTINGHFPLLCQFTRGYASAQSAFLIFLGYDKMLRSNSLFSRESSKVSSTLPLLSAKRCSSKSFLAPLDPQGPHWIHWIHWLRQRGHEMIQNGNLFIENIIIHHQNFGVLPLLPSKFSTPYFKNPRKRWNGHSPQKNPGDRFCSIL